MFGYVIPLYIIIQQAVILLYEGEFKKLNIEDDVMVWLWLVLKQLS